jgi:protein ImuA
MVISAAKANIIVQLQRDILPLQGFKPIPKGEAIDVGLGQIKYAFPNALFPLGVVHEFCCAGTEDSASTCGFIAGILAPLMRSGGVSLWISSSRTLFPTALKEFGIEPDKIVFVDLKKQKDVLWATEEALKCDGLSAVVGEISEISFTASRRLQLAVEQSRVTGFILRINPRNLNTTACVSRWKISALPSGLPDDMPGIGFPRWNVELLKVRNGKPGNWQIEWKAGRFRHCSRLTSIPRELQKKTG